MTDLMNWEPPKCGCGQIHTTFPNAKGVSNHGHSVVCPANPVYWKPEDWPPYLDDEGQGVLQFVRRDLAQSAFGVLDLLYVEGLFDGQDDDVEVDIVWMHPKRYDATDTLEISDELNGVAQYWRVRS